VGKAGDPNGRLFQPCWYCGTGVHRDKLTKDHQVPLSRGGRKGQSNVVPACRRCNQDKSDSTVEEYRQRIIARTPGLSSWRFAGEEGHANKPPARNTRAVGLVLTLKEEYEREIACLTKEENRGQNHKAHVIRYDFDDPEEQRLAVCLRKAADFAEAYDGGIMDMTLTHDSDGPIVSLFTDDRVDTEAALIEQAGAAERMLAVVGKRLDSQPDMREMVEAQRVRLANAVYVSQEARRDD